MTLTESQALQPDDIVSPREEPMINNTDANEASHSMNESTDASLDAPPTASQVQPSHRNKRPGSLRLERVFSVAAVLGLIVVAWVVASQIKTADATGVATNEITLKQVRVGVTSVPQLESPNLMSSYRGMVIPRREAALAFRRSGRIESIRVEAGDVVKQGDLIAELDTADLEAQLLVSESELAVAKAEYEEAFAGPRGQTILAAKARVEQLQAQERAAQSRLRRQRELIRSRATSTESLETEQYAVNRLQAAIMEANSQLEELEEGTRREQILAAKSRVAMAEAALRLVRVNLSDSRLVAPFDCVIGQRHLDEGAMASSNVSTVSIIEKPPLEARFGLPSSVARSLTVGDSVEISVGMSASDEEYSTCGATIVRMQPRVDPITRTREIVVQFEAEDVSFVGEPATIWLPWSADKPSSLLASDQTQVWVPSTALVRNVRGLWGLYILSQISDTDSLGSDQAEVRGEVIMRDAKVIRTAGVQTLVSVKLEPSELVITDGLHRVGPGTLVVADAPSDVNFRRRLTMDGSNR